MNILDGIPWHGDVEVTINHNGTITTERFHNLIVNDGKNLLRDMLLGVVSDASIKYIALGNGTEGADAGQHTLVNELFRKAITTTANGASAGQGTSLVYIAPYEANFVIEEIGWFAGASATSSPNSGTMIARVLWHQDKNDQKSLQISRTDSLG